MDKYTVAFSGEVKTNLRLKKELRESDGFLEVLKLPSRILQAWSRSPSSVELRPSELSRFFSPETEESRALVDACRLARRMTVYISFFPISITDDLLRVDVAFYSKGQDTPLFCFSVMYRKNGEVYAARVEVPTNQARIIAQDEATNRRYGYK